MGTARADAAKAPPPDAPGPRQSADTRARLRERLAAGRDAYAVDASAGSAGLEVLARYADHIDGLVRDIAAAAIWGRGPDGYRDALDRLRELLS